MALLVDERIAIADETFRRRSRLARERLQLLSRNNLKVRQKAFILACGGSAEPVKKQANQKKRNKKDTLEETKELLEKGVPLEEVAAKRGLVVSTIITHAEKLLQSGARLDFGYLSPEKELLPVLLEAVAKHGFAKLAPVRYYLERRGYEISYEELRVARLSLWFQKKK